MKKNGINRREFIKRTSLAAISISPAIAALSQIIGCREYETSKIIDCAFRLTNYKTLLNVEFYFMNCRYDFDFINRKGRVIAETDSPPSFMIVRLPQQHIAEQYYDLSNSSGTCNLGEPSIDSLKLLQNWTAVTRITGYSYLAFRICKTDDDVIINLNEDALMDWNNRIFELQINSKLETCKKAEKSLFQDDENTYPLNYKTDTQNPTSVFSYEKFPKVNDLYVSGDSYLPATVIEAPWRLFISPIYKDNYEFHWDFSKKSSKELVKDKTELWMASLAIIKKCQDTSNNRKADLEYGIMDVKVIGSADNSNSSSTDPFLTGNSLPTVNDRKRLVDLYINYKLLTRTNKLTFSPLGISTFLEFKNDRANHPNDIPLHEWKQLISFGRDQEVLVADLIIDKEFGHQMLHLRTTKRRTKAGVSYLDYREYLMPLEITKEYNYPTSAEANPHNSPFKKIEFIDIKPKRICPVALSGQKLEFGILPAKTSYAYIPMMQVTDSNNNVISSRKIEFSYKATDWQDNVVYFKKKIQAVEKDALEFIGKVGPGNQHLEKLNNFFDKSTAELDNHVMAYREFFANIEIIKADLQNPFESYREQLASFRNLISKSAEENRENIKAQLTALNELVKRYESIINLKSLKDTINRKLEAVNLIPLNLHVEYEAFLMEINSFYAGIKTEIDKISYDSISKEIISQIKSELTSLYDSVAYTELFGNIRSTVRVKLKNIADISLKPKVIEKLNEIIKYIQHTRDNVTLPDLVKSQFDQIKNRVETLATYVNSAANLNDTNIDTYITGIRNEVGVLGNEYQNAKSEILLLLYDFPVMNINDMVKYQVYERWKKVQALEDEIPNLIKIGRQQIAFTEHVGEKLKEQVSKLETEYLVFKGKILADSRGVIDIFNNAAVPQLEKARVCIGSLNKLVNEEILVDVKYAKEYLDANGSIEKIKSQVFAEILESSKENIKGKIRNIANEMGGLVNPELPLDYLTYLKDTKQIAEDLINNNPLLKDLNEGYNDLVFLGESVKTDLENLKDIKKIDPKVFFKGLQAKILGSVDLFEILKIDFDKPRLTRTDKEIVYSFVTNEIQEFSGGGVFKLLNINACATPPTTSRLIIVFRKSIRNINEYSSDVTFSDFSLKFFDLITVCFKSFGITKTNNGPQKTILKIDNVRLEGPLDFIGKLTEKLSIPGTGLRVIPSFNKIEIGYTIGLPSIQFPGFTLANLKFDIGVNIPLPTSNSVKSISFTLGINRPDDKFLVSAGIFGGRGHFVMELTTEKVIKIDLSIEFGGYFGLDIGIAKGFVFLFAGIRYLQASGDKTKITAYVICSGGVCVFGFISVTITFLVALMGSGDELYGVAQAEYCVKIAFFKKSFKLSFEYRIKGKKRSPAGSGNAGSLSNNENPCLSGMNELGGYTFEDTFDKLNSLKQYISYFKI